VLNVSNLNVIRASQISNRPCDLQNPIVAARAQGKAADRRFEQARSVGIELTVSSQRAPVQCGVDTNRHVLKAGGQSLTRFDDALADNSGRLAARACGQGRQRNGRHVGDQIDLITERTREAIAIPLHLQRRATTFVQRITSVAARASLRCHVAMSTYDDKNRFLLQPQPATVGQALKRHREVRGMSQRELASRLGVDQGTLGRWERGIRVPKGRFASKIESL